MWKPGPAGYKPGKCFSKPQSTRRVTAEEIRSRFETSYLTPFLTDCHINEWMALDAEERTLPPISKAAFEAVSKLMADAKDVKTTKICRLTEHKCTTTMKQKLDMLLLTKGHPILMHPRPGQAFSAFFMIYSCHVLDPDNLTGWNDDVINLTTKDSPLERFLHAKCKRFEQCEQLGYEHQNQEMYNHYIACHHAAQDVIKYSVLGHKYPQSPRDYTNLRVQTELEYSQRQASLISICYLRYKKTKKDAESRTKHFLTFKAEFDAAIIPDPFLVPYPINSLVNWYGEDLRTDLQDIETLRKSLIECYVSIEHDMKRKTSSKIRDLAAELEADAITKGKLSVRSSEQHSVQSNCSKGSQHSRTSRLAMMLAKMKIDTSEKSESSENAGINLTKISKKGMNKDAYIKAVQQAAKLNVGTPELLPTGEYMEAEHQHVSKLVDELEQLDPSLTNFKKDKSKNGDASLGKKPPE